MGSLSDLSIWSTDVIFLNKVVSIQAGALLDSVSGQNIRINESARILLNSLNGKKTFQEILDFISARGLRVTISYEKAPSVRILQRVVAASGPIFGIVGAQIIALTIFILPPISLAWWIVSLSGFLHLYLFLPWTVDGKIIWRKSS